MYEACEFVCLISKKKNFKEGYYEKDRKSDYIVNNHSGDFNADRFGRQKMVVLG
jgi:hypothetical protein